MDAGADEGLFVTDEAAAVLGEDGAPVHFGPDGAEVQAAVAFEDAENHAGAPFVDGGADEALAADLLDEGVELYVQGDAGEAAGVVAEAGPGGFGEVMEGAVDEVYELGVEADAAALEEVEEVGAGAFGDFPDGAGLDGDVAGVLDVFEHGYGVFRRVRGSWRAGRRRG